MGAHAGPNIAEQGLTFYLGPRTNRSGLDLEYVIVAGGGGGNRGNNFSAGGGAGGLILTKNPHTPGIYPIVIGAPGTPYSEGVSSASNGGDSVAFGLTAKGGGRSGQSGTPGADGGSGGGNAYYLNVPTSYGGLGLQPSLTPGIGYGAPVSRRQASMPRGGGAGGEQPGANYYDGLEVWGTTYAIGGYNGGNSGVGQAGRPNSGDGGGGVGALSPAPRIASAAGGGVVKIRYKGSQKATGGTVTSDGTYTYHEFTSNGNFEINRIRDIISGNYCELINDSVSVSQNNDVGIITLDGVDDYVIIPFSSIFNFTTNDFTVSCWNKVIVDKTGFGGIITADNLGDNTWKFFKDNNQQFYKARSGSTVLNFPAYTVGQFHCYTMTKSGSTLKIYFDGVFVTENTSSASPVSFSNDLALGSYRRNDAINGNYLFNQSISGIQIYNRALSADEITQNFDATRSQYGV